MNPTIPPLTDDLGPDTAFFESFKDFAAAGKTYVVLGDTPRKKGQRKNVKSAKKETQDVLAISPEGLEYAGGVADPTRFWYAFGSGTLRCNDHPATVAEAQAFFNHLRRLIRSTADKKAAVFEMGPGTSR